MQETAATETHAIVTALVSQVRSVRDQQGRSRKAPLNWDRKIAEVHAESSQPNIATTTTNYLQPTNLPSCTPHTLQQV